MFSLTFIYYTYAMFIWYVFFWVPKRFGQVSRFNVEQLGRVGDESGIIHQNDEENFKAVVRELEHDR